MAPSPFLVGKLPAHGDFVVRGLTPAAREVWDQAGARMLDVLHATAGSDFDALHVAAPPWRFVTTGEGGWSAGALAPSVDAVGRRYLLAVGLTGLSPAIAGAAGLALAQAAEALIYQALETGLSADLLLAAASERLGALVGELHSSATALAAAPAGPGAWWTLGSAGFAASALVAGSPPADLFARTVAGASSVEPQP